MSSKTLTLDDLFRAIHNAVLKAQQLTEQQHMRQLRNYFDDEYRCLTQRIWVPSNLPDAANDDYMPMDVPLMGMVPPSAIKIKRMKMNFKINLKGFEEHYEEGKKVEKVGFRIKPEKDTRHAPLEVDLGGIGGGSFFGGKRKPILANVDIEFEAGEPSESFLRINDHLIKSVKAEYNQVKKKDKISDGD